MCICRNRNKNALKTSKIDRKQLCCQIRIKTKCALREIVEGDMAAQNKWEGNMSFNN